MSKLTSYEDYLKLSTEASNLSEQAHDQPKYGNVPYMVHLRHVQEVLSRFGYHINNQSEFSIRTANLLIAAWLHDVIEDTALERHHLAFHFGDTIAELAWRVSDEPGDSRNEKNIATLPKIRASEDAVIIKLADRIANVEVALSLKAQHKGTKLLDKYLKEHAFFRQQLFRNDNLPMWECLDNLLNKR